MTTEKIDVEEYVLQSISGIIPMEQWFFHKRNKTDPFDYYSPEEARKIKRKFRKLKRKAKVQKDSFAANMWRKVNSLLREKEGG